MITSLGFLRYLRFSSVLCLIPLGLFAGCNSNSVPPHTAPVVTQQPANQTVNAGSSATFTAAASGNPSPTVQWQVAPVNGPFAAISGATSTTLTVMATSSGQNGNQYEAVFTNSNGDIISLPATLTVNFAPLITQQPANQSVTAGATATFSASARSQPGATVQWQVSQNGAAFANVSGGTSAVLAITNTTVSQTGSLYQAIFTNSIGSATTATAKLTVAPAGPSAGRVILGGPVAGATVSAFSISSTGIVSPTPIGSTFTQPDGAYSLTLPAGFSGPVLLNSAGGSYVDVVTGQVIQAGALSAIVSNASGSIAADITPLTSVSAQLTLQLAAAAAASPALIENNVKSAVGTYFGGLSDISITPLVDVGTTNCAADASQAGVDMSLILAATAQLAANNGVTSSSLTAALIQDLKTDGLFDGVADGAPISVPLANGTGTIDLCLIEGGCQVGHGRLPQALAAAEAVFQKSSANVCNARLSQAASRNLNNPVNSAAFPPPPGAVQMSVSGAITGLNPAQTATLRVSTFGLPNHCITAASSGCPGGSLDITGDDNFSATFGALLPGFTGRNLSVTVSDPLNEACQITSPTAPDAEVSPNAPLDISGIQISCAAITHRVSVLVSGLAQGQSLQLRNSGIETLEVDSNGESSFHSPMSFGNAYNVSVLRQPPNETCSVSGTGAGAIVGDTLVVVNCGSSATGTLLNGPRGLALNRNQSKL